MAHFLFVAMQRISDNLRDLIRTVVVPMGYELLGVMLLPGERDGQVLRVYIDAESGIRMEDCAAVSRQLSSMLDVEDPVAGDYSLEVSSPGMDRPLFEAAHFRRFVGSMAKIKLSKSVTGRRSYKGFLRGVEGDCVLIEVDAERFSLPLDQIEIARLVPQF